MFYAGAFSFYALRMKPSADAPNPTPVAPALMRTDLPIGPKRQGKVRDVYDAQLKDGTPVTVLITTDRISAYDVVMPNGVPHKGQVLTQISSFWFEMINRQRQQKNSPPEGLPSDAGLQETGSGAHTGGLSKELSGPLPGVHVVSENPMDLLGMTPELAEPLYGRTVIGKRCEVVPIECVVRGYLAGSGWKEYQENQSVCGVALPEGLQQCSRLPEPIFTPATKAQEGHDENISFERAAEIVGASLMARLRDWSIAIYEMGHRYAQERGIILADTKFEFGIPLDDADGTPILIDEALTPDSSRFWPADQYEPGRDQESFDKQYVRNHLEGLVVAGQWAKAPPGPTLPDDVVLNTLHKYTDAFVRLTGAAPRLS